MPEPSPRTNDTSAPTPIDLGVVQQEILAELHAAELRAAELRGQLQLIERLIQESQRPMMSGAPLGAPSEEHTNGDHA